MTGLMQFRFASIRSLTFVPAQEDPTASLELIADMTPDIARSMGCHDSLYRADGSPHPGPTRVDLGEARLRDVDVTLPSGTSEGGVDTYRPEICHSFRVSRHAKSENRLLIHMLIRIKGHFDDLVSFLQNQNKEQFEFAIRALQQEFNWNSEETQGERVDMGSGKKEAGGPLFSGAACPFCDRGTPKNEDGLHMLPSGDVSVCPRGPSKEVGTPEAGPALASSREMGGRKKRQQRTRQPQQPTAEEIDSTVSVN